RIAGRKGKAFALRDGVRLGEEESALGARADRGVERLDEKLILVRLADRHRLERDFTARGKVSLEPVTVGEPDENQLLVETLYTAISPGTERAFLLAEPNTITQRKGFPFPPGYSNVGRVLAVGS